MSCNIWFFIILLLITIIIGLISFSNLKVNDLESFTDLDTANNIMLNNNTINRLLNQLQNVNPNVQLINYDPNQVYQDYQQNISSNINIINTQLSSLYNSNISVNNSKLTQLENTVTDLENLITNLGLNALNNKNIIQ